MFSRLSGLFTLALVALVAATSGQSSSASASASATTSVALAASTATSASRPTYTNPILDDVAADPWVLRDGDYYYLMFTNGANITLYRSKELTDWRGADKKTLWVPPPGQDYSTDLWAPEIHRIDGRWYVIFTADPNNDTPPPQVDQLCTFNCPAVHHRMYVLESSGGDIWRSSYRFKGQLDTFDQFAIDGTYFQHESGLYHIYSCWFDAYQSWPANLCITQLRNPWTVASNLTERTVISVPTNPWEKTPYGRTANERLSSNEGPQQLVSRTTGQHFVIYSAARSDNPNYCLGQLALRPGGDPMNPADWTKRADGCVFAQSKRHQAYGVGHASFVRSPDGAEDWIVYHGMRNAWTGWSARTVRAQRFGWHGDGSPRFPEPGYGPYEVPSS